MVARRKTSVQPTLSPVHRELAAIESLFARLFKLDLPAGGQPAISFLLHPSALSESAVIERGLPAATWRHLQRLGYSRDEIATVVGNSAKTIRRKEARSEPLDDAEGDRTMRLLRITIEAVDAFGDPEKALTWMRRSNTALLGKTPLETLATEAGTALVRRALGVIAYGGVA